MSGRAGKVEPVPGVAAEAARGAAHNGVTVPRDAAAVAAGAGPAPEPVRFHDEPLAGMRPDVREGARTFNRDLSWLEFNARVLRQAFDERLPLLERTRFLAIFTSNLDEFVMKRVGFLLRCVETRAAPDGDDAPSPKQLLTVVRRTFEHLEEQQSLVYERVIRPGLAREGIELLDWSELEEDERLRLRDWYRVNVFPALTPLAVDPGHRFPFISNLSNNIGVLMTEPGHDEPLFARVKIPSGQGFPWWVRVPGPDGRSPERRDSGRGRFVQLYDLIRHNLEDLFPGMTLTEVMPFRVTRAADGALPGDDTEEDADNLLHFVEAQLKSRRFAKVVRLEVSRTASPGFVRRVVEMFKIYPEDVDPSQGLLDFRSLYEIADLPRPDLKAPAWTPVIPARLAERQESIFDTIRRGDLLVHHPYESFAASAERFIAEAAADPAVVTIKQTIYRTSRDSPFVHHLIRAAESGKQVACLVELRARFDESRNVRLAQALEKAGVHVAYGVLGYKTHCKAALVVRREADALRCYAHIGTGNYNPATAQLYTDLGLFTCDPEITADIVDMFNLLTGRSRKKDYRRLLVAPVTMKDTFLRLVQREIDIAQAHARGRSPVGGRIMAKMNALEDSGMTRALYAASQAGVRVDLFVRGFCCLRPGVPGLSDNIRVTSIIGRFLEHSRIFHFGAGREDPLDGDWYFGSADWMYRNLEQRVEAVCPALDRGVRQRLLRIFQVMEADRRHAWALRSDGRYVLKTPEEFGASELGDLGTFEVLMRDALASA
jgi:polyphosphate kinase